MNVSRQTVSHWENGRILPDIESVIQLSQVLQYDFLADSKEIMSDAGETGKIVASFTDETLPKPPSKLRNRRRRWWVLAGVVVCLLVVAAAVGWRLARRDTAKICGSLSRAR